MIQGLSDNLSRSALGGILEMAAATKAKTSGHGGGGVCLASLASLLLLLSFYSHFLGARVHPFLNPNSANPFLDRLVGSNSSRNDVLNPISMSDEDPCHGRYIYIHDLPRRFNAGLLVNCRVLTRGTDGNMCPYLENTGLGPPVEDPEGVLSKGSWYRTNQFLLEVIFHEKMKRYPCSTQDSSLASAVYVPYYAGLDISQYLYSDEISVRDAAGLDLVRWLSGRPEWGRMSGMDHFFVAGRIAWDFRRQLDDPSDWGTKLMFLPEAQNMTLLSVESSVWNNDFAIPYPTFFHPSKDVEVSEWQERMRKQNRIHLFTFVGAPRPEPQLTIRGEVIRQCVASSGKCHWVNCSSDSNNCDNPVNVMMEFQRSVFCLQPGGDSYTRRSTFDSILCGCIPVFFHTGAAYVQYLWHLPKNYTSYSVYIPMNNSTKADIESVLVRIPDHDVWAMREEVIRLIPSIVYADPRSSEQTFKDAFDLTVKGVLDRVEQTREVIAAGGDPSIGFAEQNHHKFDLAW